MNAQIANAIAEVPREVAQIDAGEEPAERAAEVVGLLRPRRRLERHRAGDHVVESQETRVGVAGPRVRRAHRGFDVFARPAAEGRLAAPELHQQDRDGEHVGRGRELLRVHLLGRHVAGRAEDAVPARRGGHGGGDAEVDDLDLALFVDHHVARGHVAVHDVHAPVGVVERATDLDADVRALLGRETYPRARARARTALVGHGRAQELREARAFDELHGEEIRPPLDPELVHRDDVRVRERDGGLCFEHEPPHELVVRRELVADLLHDELLLEASRAPKRGEHDARHSAPRELAFENVLAEDLGVHTRSADTSP